MRPYGNFRSFIINGENLKKPAVINMPKTNCTSGDMFSVDHDFAEKFRMNMNETVDKFIFTQIQPFVDSVSTMEISKEDLVVAVELIQRKRSAKNNFGTDTLISENINAAAAYWELDQAYKRGYGTGYKKSRQDLLNFLENGEDNEQ